MTAPRLAYRLSEVAEMLGVDTDTLYKEIRAGRLVAHKIRRRTVIYVADLERYAAGRDVIVHSAQLEARPDPSPANVTALSASRRVARSRQPRQRVERRVTPLKVMPS